MFTLVKAYADWCGPCRIYNKSFRRVMQKHDLTYRDLNVDNDSDAPQFNVELLPTTILLKDGTEVARISGALIERNLEAFLTEHGAI